LASSSHVTTNGKRYRHGLVHVPTSLSSVGGVVALTGAELRGEWGMTIEGTTKAPVLFVPEGRNLKLVSAGAGVCASGWIVYSCER
jgi:hypothetical protein